LTKDQISCLEFAVTIEKVFASISFSETRRKLCRTIPSYWRKKKPNKYSFLAPTEIMLLLLHSYFTISGFYSGL